MFGIQIVYGNREAATLNMFTVGNIMFSLNSVQLCTLVRESPAHCV